MLRGLFCSRSLLQNVGLFGASRLTLRSFSSSSLRIAERKKRKQAAFKNEESLSRLTEYCMADEELRSQELVNLFADSNSTLRKLKTGSIEEIQEAMVPVEEKVRTLVSNYSKGERIIALLRDSILCRGFVKRVKMIPPKPTRKKKRSEEAIPFSVEDSGTYDASSIPSGLEIYNLADPTNMNPVLVELVVEMKNAPSRSDDCMQVYAYNLPKTVNERLVREALCNVGNPREIEIFHTAAPKVASSRMHVAQEVALRNSPVNAIIRFDDREAFERAIRIEAKLFGVLCEAADREVDSARMMFLENASIKRYLNIFGFKEKVRVEEIQNLLAATAREAGHEVLGFEKARVDSVDSGHQVTVKFPSFISAYKMFHLLRSKPILGTKVCFSMARSKWSDSFRAYIDAPSLAVSD